MPALIYNKQKIIYIGIEKCAMTRIIGYFGATWPQPEGTECIFHPASESISSEKSYTEYKDKYPSYFV